MNPLIIGGDKRQYYMAKFLVSKGFAISYFGELFFGGAAVREIRGKEKLFSELDDGRFELVLLPVPVGDEVVKGTFGKLRVRELLSHLGKVKRIYGGKIPSSLYGIKGDIEIDDFMKEDAITLENAALTAENAIIEAILISDLSMTGSNSLVIGYGKCGQMLVDRLRGLRSNVTVAEIDPSKSSLAKSYGVKTVEVESLSGYDFVFQTAPDYDMDKKLMMTCLEDEEKNPIIIDISSASAIDSDYAQSIGILMKKCPGLPGRYTAKTAGEKLGAYVLGKERKHGYCG